MAGSGMMGYDLWGALRTGSTPVIFQALLAGAPFTVTLLGILGIHELGHYVAARLHGVRATLPYFIPMPFGLGTLGAFIAIRSPMRNRKVLFDIGLAGPIAGFVAAVPLFLLGLLLSADSVVAVGHPGRTINSLGSSILVNGLVDLVYDLPATRTLLLHPVYFAAWLGFFLTGINLLPVGQLDGGHATYALAGRFAYILGIVTFVGLLIAGVTLSPNWYIWAFFVMLGGLRHPPPLNDITGVGPARTAIGLAMVMLFILIFTPVPFR
jgi:membrane-associated protease RseP (regulator of RpoE activity)